MKIDVGKFTVYPLLDGYFWLDQGLMVRQMSAVRDKVYPADELGRIKLAARCFLITGDSPFLPLLFDTGVGNPKDPINTPIAGRSYSEFLNIDQSQGNLILNLRRAGFGPEDIRTVTQSHMHFDHTGWHTFTDKEGEIVPTFSNATYISHSGEYGSAVWDHPTSLKSYHRESLLPVPLCTICVPSVSGRMLAGKMCLFWDSYDLVKGLRLTYTGGHSRGHWIVELSSMGRRAMLPGDLIPTHKYLTRPDTMMSYDLRHDEVYETKIELLKKAEHDNCLILLDHDPDFIGGYVDKHKQWFNFDPLEKYIKNS